ncbi:MAG: 50S ribosomal protein L29 [Candidatus Andersenbacteria bacterium]
MANILTVADLRKRSASDLTKLLSQMHEQLRAKQFEARSGQLKKMHEIKSLRRSIAKVQTILGEAR